MRISRKAPVGAACALAVCVGVVIGCQQLRPPPDRNAARDAAATHNAAPVAAKPAKMPRLAALVELPTGIEIGRGPFSGRVGLAMPDAIARWIMGWVGAPQLLGARMAAPIDLIVADPKAFDRPVAALLEVRDAAALRKSFPESDRVIVRGDHALVGDPALIKALEHYAFDTVAGLREPKHPSAILFRPLLVAYANEITRAGARAKWERGGAGKLAGIVLARLAKETQRVQVSLDLSGGRAAVIVAAHAQPGSALGRFFAAQAPSNFRLLSKLSGAASPALLVAGHMALGPARKAFLALTRQTVAARFGALVPPRVARGMASRLDSFTGEFALAMRGLHQPRKAPDVQALVAVDDGARAKAGIDAMAPLMMKAARRAGGGTVAGVHRSHSYRAHALTYRGVRIGEEMITYDLSHASPLRRRALAGDAAAPVKIDIAGFGKLLALARGNIRALVDAARGHGPGYEPTAALAAQVAAARARKDSLLIALELPALLPRASASLHLPPLTTIAVGFKRGALRVHLTSGPR